MIFSIGYHIKFCLLMFWIADERDGLVPTRCTGSARVRAGPSLALVSFGLALFGENLACVAGFARFRPV